MRWLMFGVLAITVPMALACGGGGDVAVSEPAKEQVNLAFSNWKIEWVNDGSKREFDFLNDGTFVDPRHPSNVNSFTVDGDTIHMEYNDSFVIYDGEIIDKNTMGGTYKTKKGLEGPWRGKRLILD